MRCDLKQLGNLEDLNEYIIEKLNMELMDDRIESVIDTIKGMEHVIYEHEEFKNDDHAGDLITLEEMKKFIGYDCLYSIDAKHGGVWGQAYIIVDKNLNYIGFVRTI